MIIKLKVKMSDLHVMRGEKKHFHLQIGGHFISTNDHHLYTHNYLTSEHFKLGLSKLMQQ